MDNLKKTAEELKEMEAQMEGVVDINYKRYNNKYMDVAAEHMMEMKRAKERKVDSQMAEANEETADRLFNKLRGTIII